MLKITKLILFADTIVYLKNSKITFKTFNLNVCKYAKILYGNNNLIELNVNKSDFKEIRIKCQTI